MNQPSRGVTRIEALLIRGIVFFIAMLATPGHHCKPDRAGQAKAGLQKFAWALGTYVQDTGSLPTSIDALIRQPDSVIHWKGPYLHASQIIDPWGTEYRYQTPGTGNRPFEVRSLGSDRAAGGSGDAGDLTNWD